MERLAYLPAGRIINTHGFRGTVKLESWCDSPEILAELETLYFLENGTYCAREVLRASVFKQFVLMDLRGVDSEEAANRLRGVEVFAAREDIPVAEGDFLIADLLGLPVKDADSDALLGELKEINTSGARDLYVVRTPQGDSMIPAVPQFIIRIDPEDAIYVRPIPGLLDGGAENV
ncbi:MAG: 16S rRNA processing protein RimM [Clostridia bacterium]|nr:16S rRNA processing protein RimM [Clostridia bacterium]